MRLALLCAALGLALLAQHFFDLTAAGADSIALALVLAAVAALSFGLSGAQLLPEPAPASPIAPRPLQRLRLLLLATGALLALGAYPLLEPNRFTAAGTLALFGGVGLCCTVLWDGPPPSAGFVRTLIQGWHNGYLSIRREWLVLVALIAIGAGLRLYQLDDLPAEAGTDIPLKLWVVRGILAGERPIFSTVYPGRETLFFYLTALYAMFFGADQFALKLVSVLVSLATIPALYALGARWFGRSSGLLAAALLTLSPWHIAISRIGFRGVMVALVVALTLLALDRVLTRAARRDFLLLGLVAGVGCYTYTACLMILPTLALVWAGQSVRGFVGKNGRQRPEPWWRALQPGWLITVLVAGLLLLPLTRFAVSDFEQFFLRPGSRITSREAVMSVSMPALLAQNALRSIGMFNLRGDVVFIQNVPGRRQLGQVSGTLFLLGVGVMLVCWRRRSLALSGIFLLTMQLPSALALAFPNEVPGAVRASGALIPAYLLAALPLVILVRAVGFQSNSGSSANGEQAGRLMQSNQLLMLLMIAVLLVFEGRETTERYFGEYRDAQPWGNFPMTRTIAEAIDAFGGQGLALMPRYNFWTDGNAIRVQLKRVPPEMYQEVPQIDMALFATFPQHTMVILRPDDNKTLNTLRTLAPRGVLVNRYSPEGRLMFQIFYIER